MRFLAVLVFCLSLLFSSAQTSIDEITTEFFSLYSKSPHKAIDYAFSSNKWMMDTIYMLSRSFNNTYGKYRMAAALRGGCLRLSLTAI